MPYAHVVDNKIVTYPLYEGDIKLLYPSTSFTHPLQIDDLQEFGVVEVVETAAPEVDYRTQRIAEADPALIDGAWTQQWIIEPLSAEEQQRLTDNQATSVRDDRNKRLADCDWTQLPDAPVDAAAWAAYRQDLRDVTSQPGFPWTIEWPQQPS